MSSIYYRLGQQAALEKIGADDDGDKELSELLDFAIRFEADEDLGPRSHLSPEEKQERLRQVLQSQAEEPIPSKDEFTSGVRTLTGILGSGLGGITGGIAGAASGPRQALPRGLVGAGAGALGGGLLGAGLGHLEGRKFESKHLPEMQEAQEQAHQLANSPEEMQALLERMYSSNK